MSSTNVQSMYEITTKEDHDAFIANNNRGVIFFGSSACHYCRDMIPVVQRLMVQYPSVKFAHVEINKTQVKDLGRGVPTFVGYKDHVAIDSVVGANKQALSLMIINKLL